MPDSLITVDFKNLGKSTLVTFTHAGFPEQEDSDDHNKGWTSCFEKFARLIEQKKIR